MMSSMQENLECGHLYMEARRQLKVKWPMVHLQRKAKAKIHRLA